MTLLLSLAGSRSLNSSVKSHRNHIERNPALDLVAVFCGERSRVGVQWKPEVLILSGSTGSDWQVLSNYLPSYERTSSFSILIGSVPEEHLKNTP